MNIKNSIKRKKSIIAKVSDATKIIGEVNYDRTNTSMLYDAYSAIDGALDELINITLEDNIARVEF